MTIPGTPGKRKPIIW